MYRIGQKYKIELKSGIYYTAEILEEDDFAISIKTIRNEEITISKYEIKRSLLINSSLSSYGGNCDGSDR